MFKIELWIIKNWPLVAFLKTNHWLCFFISFLFWPCHYHHYHLDNNQHSNSLFVSLSLSPLSLSFSNNKEQHSFDKLPLHYQHLSPFFVFLIDYVKTNIQNDLKGLFCLSWYFDHKNEDGKWICFITSYLSMFDEHEKMKMKQNLIEIR